MHAGERERGFALVAALWTTIILAIVVASVQQLSWADAKLVRGNQATAQLSETVDAAVNIIILRLLGPPTVQLPLDGTPFDVSFDGYIVRASVQDEVGKIDLNMAGETMLRQLLTFVGLDGTDVDVIADRILDWRETTPGRRLNGAKVDDYHAAGLPYGPRNGPFRSVSELRMVLGMTQELYHSIAPFLTVYSQTAWIDPTLAPPQVLELLASLDAGAMAELRRREGERSSALLSSLKQIAVPGHAFTITTELDGPGTARIRKTVVVRMTGRARMPIWVYQWR